MANQGRPRRMRARRHHLELVSSEEWPDDVFPLLEMARDGFLEREAPDPGPEVLAFLEHPAHGKVDADGTLVRHAAPEPIELAEHPVRRAPRRALVAAGGAVAALTLVALGIRPTLTDSKAIVSTARSTVPTTPATGAPATAAPAPPPAPTTAAAATTALEPDPVVAVVDSVAATDPPTTVETAPPPAAPKPAAPTTAKPKTRSTTGKAASPPTTPSPASSARAAVLAYYDASNARGRCVAHQPSKSTSADLTRVCGPEPVPPQNLYRYWAARDQWNECAQPMYERGFGEERVVTACGAKPERAQFNVPPNPYSRSQN